MARKAGFFLQLVIFAALWIVGSMFFSDFGGSIGAKGSMLFIGESIMGTDSLANDGGGVADLIFAFIITAAVYYIIAVILAYILTRLFGRRVKK